MQSIARDSEGSDASLYGGAVDGLGDEGDEADGASGPLRHERFGQLAQIFSVLGVPTRGELEWASEVAVRRVSELVAAITSQPFSPLSETGREEERRGLLRKQVVKSPLHNRFITAT